VLAVESALSALNEVGDFDPHVVMTDIQMPGMDGFELLGRLRENRPDTDVIVFTGHGDVQGTIDAIQRGAFDYLTKPLDLEEAVAVVERCVEKRRRGKRAEPIGEGDADIEPGGLVGRHPSMIRVYKTIGAVANSGAVVLVRGETGTGKELVARTIHENSPRRDRPFVAVNCAAVPESLLESELFGHVAGAFTGADKSRKGRFELAADGTLFLDEVGDTSLAFQAKLLRVLQEHEFYPVGGEKPVHTDARIIAATNRCLEEMVPEGTFRQDLFFRLQVVEIRVPPLRDRREDIPLLVRHIVARAAVEMDSKAPVIPPDVMEDLVHREWPGNVRELENVVLRALLTGRGPALTPSDVRAPGSTAEDDDASSVSLSAVRALAERRHVSQVLERTRGNKSEAARILEVSRPTLNRIIKEYELDVP